MPALPAGFLGAFSIERLPTEVAITDCVKRFDQGTMKVLARTHWGTTMIPIPLGKKYWVTVTGQTTKLVKCEACGYEYVYLFETSASGEGFSPFNLNDASAQGSARAEAEAYLNAGLQQECAVVPCASCGVVQYDMIPVARRQFRPWMLYVAIFLGTVGAILLVPAMIVAVVAFEPTAGAGFQVTSAVLWTCSAALLLCGFVFFYLRSLWQHRYDPNSMPAELRKMWGAALSVSKDEFLRIMQRPS